MTVGISEEFHVIASEDEICGHRCGQAGAAQLLTFYCTPRALVGRYVILTMWNHLPYHFHLCEVKVYGNKHYPSE